ncbi:hypothetical protein [Promicromonospora aerolata]|uniref:Uncharacterized protein n=1 Tax=Promicromonospora aerolata TaxID=195749 RepID=A0ABW4VAI9_9MICO
MLPDGRGGQNDDAGEAWAGRFEFFLTNPDDQPDRSRWDTELAFKLAD